MKVVEITVFKDIYGRKIPSFVGEYDVIYCHEDYVAVGLAGREFYKIPWDNVEIKR